MKVVSFSGCSEFVLSNYYRKYVSKIIWSLEGNFNRNVLFRKQSPYFYLINKDTVISQLRNTQTNWHTPLQFQVFKVKDLNQEEHQIQNFKLTKPTFWTSVAASESLA